MVEETRQGDSPSGNPSVRRERSDASFGWILGLVAGSALFGLFVFAVVWLIFRDESKHLAEVRKSPYPLAPKPSTALPPEPRLEQLDRLAEDERSNVYLRLKAKEDILARYGAAGDKGYVHIPIEQAIRVLATTKKLKARAEKAGPVPRDNGLVDGGEPNSGRLFNRRKPRWYGQ